MVMVEEKLAPIHKREEISELILLVSTSKGAFLYYADPDRRHWDVNGPHFLGSIVHHLILDPRDNKTLIASVQSFKDDNIIYRSQDLGKSWTPATKNPAFSTEKLNRTLDHICYISPGHKSEKNVWYAGTAPYGLFKSEDGGETWYEIVGFNCQSMLEKMIAKNNDPNNSRLHSIIIHPDNKKHIYIGLSKGGIFESIDSGKSWKSLNQGLDNKKLNPKAIYDPYSIILHPLSPERLFQQSRHGIFRLDRSDSKWIHIGKNLPKGIGDIGLPITIHPSDPNTIWVFPMDNSHASSRVSPAGQPAVYCSQDAGDSWFRQDIGLPMRNAWFTVTRKCLSTDCMSNAGVYFGTTSGSLWMSDNAGNSWRQIAVHLPRVKAIETGVILKK